MGVVKDSSGTGRNNYHKVWKQLDNMRDAGDIEFDWIIDPSRVSFQSQTQSSPQAFLQAIVNSYRESCWPTDTETHVWSESRGLAEVLRPMCDEYSVTCTACAGEPSHSIVSKVVGNIAHDVHKLNVLVITDYDAAGLRIASSLQDKIFEQVERLDRDLEISYKRFGVTPNQIELYNLPSHEGKVEAEAIPIGILLDELENNILALGPDVFDAADRTAAGRLALSKLVHSL